MTTFSNSEAKAHLSEMLRDLGHGDGVIITRRGRPCGRLTAVKPVAAESPPWPRCGRLFRTARR